MAETQRDGQPVQDGIDDEAEALALAVDMAVEPSADDQERERERKHKSGVYVDPNARAQSGRYGKKDTVHMSVIQSGVRTKGTFTVLRGRLHASKAFYEYQLLEGGQPYRGGAWIREKDLRLEKRG
ncbi:hypothetical protein P154DRAFT_575017 [Amniculicola lignicola CBS 123094]|uniref:Uncharacterized protein n=1 Tax=Amniculicola lignicola CBS 123094 TaxID=1392246 RepID=A0A6A5WID9_9PLEO|nr:hypothetical protein P154DRAFT_575017 [Amniculicola lignicola CBS 123094]